MGMVNTVQARNVRRSATNNTYTRVIKKCTRERSLGACAIEGQEDEGGATGNNRGAFTVKESRGE